MKYIGIHLVMNTMKSSKTRMIAVLAIAMVFVAASTASAGILESSDGAGSDSFGEAVSLSSTTGLVGAHGQDIGGNNGQGAAYLYRNLDTATGRVAENIKLIASDGAAGDEFGGTVSLSSATGLVGASGHDIDGKSDQGAAYLYKNLDTAPNIVAEHAKLTASDGAADDYFGQAASLSSATGLVGALGHDTGGKSNQGAAYFYRNLDSASGTVTQNTKLFASDGAAGDQFGVSVSLSSATGLVGAYGHAIDGNSYQGAAYLYRDLDVAAGTVTETAKLTASDGGAYNTHPE